MRIVVSMALASTLLTGCSGLVAQYVNRPIYKDRLHEPNENAKFMAIGGDYRIARVQFDTGLRVEDGADTLQRGYRWTGAEWVWVEATPRYDVCAETQADAIFTRSAKSDLGVTDQAVRAGVDGSTSDLLRLVDEAIQNATQTYNRTEVSDVVRHLGWHWCNARMNGDISASEYRNGLTQVTAEAFDTLRAGARGQPGSANNNQTQKLSPPPPPPSPPPSSPPPPVAGKNAGDPAVPPQTANPTTTKAPGD